MHFWNTKKLIEKFGSNSITEREKLRYYIFSILIFGVGCELPSWFPSDEPYNGYDLANFALMILTAVIGNVLVFKANRDSSDFISRAVCLTIPIGFKLLSALVLVSIPAYFVFERLGWISETGFSTQEKTFSMLLLMLLDLAYYALLYQAIRQINERIEARGRVGR